MRSSVESALLLYDRESRDFHIRHSRGGQPPAIFAGHESEYSKVAGRVHIVRHAIPVDGRDRNVGGVITQVCPSRGSSEWIVSHFENMSRRGRRGSAESVVGDPSAVGVVRIRENPGDEPPWAVRGKRVEAREH